MLFYMNIRGVRKVRARTVPESPYLHYCREINKKRSIFNTQNHLCNELVTMESNGFRYRNFSKFCTLCVIDIGKSL